MLASTGVPADEVAAVGLTGQMHGLTLLDRANRILRPAILWNDQRTAAECDLIRRTVGPERLIAITGNDALTGFTAPKLSGCASTSRMSGRASPTSSCRRISSVCG